MGPSGVIRRKRGVVEARWLLIVEGRRDNKAEGAWRCRVLEPKASDLGSMFEARTLEFL